MINLYWPIYKSIEKEVIELSNQIHFDDNQLTRYSIKITELLIRCSVEIEAISKDLYFKLGGHVPLNGDLYFDTHCLLLLEDNWSLSKKKLLITASNFYLQKPENKTITPLLKANKRSTSGSDWKKAYQAVKHNRTFDLHKGSIKHLLGDLGALFILNIYFKDEIYNFDNDSNTTNFPLNLGSDIFSIKLHKWRGYDRYHNYIKDEDIDECIYLTRYTPDSLEKNKAATEEMLKKREELFIKHPKFLKFIEKNKIEDYKGHNLMWDILEQNEYMDIIRVTSQESLQILKETKYEAILNKNAI